MIGSELIHLPQTKFEFLLAETQCETGRNLDSVSKNKVVGKWEVVENQTYSHPCCAFLPYLSKQALESLKKGFWQPGLSCSKSMTSLDKILK